MKHSQMDLLERRRIERECVCQECGAPLVTPKGAEVPRCARNRHHRGYLLRATWSRRAREQALQTLEEEWAGQRPRREKSGDLEDLF